MTIEMQRNQNSISDIKIKLAIEFYLLLAFQKLLASYN
jgi:hypothetical protein